jgi:predicted lipid-binding transport protein (Tim44 family)
MQKLRAWSTAGLERLFADLYEDLAQQDNSTWGRLLLKDPHSSDQDTRKRLAAKYADIQQRALEKFMVVQPVPRRVLARARAAAAASAAAAVATQQAAGKEGGVLLGTGSMPGILSPCGSCPGMGGSSASSSRPGSLIGQGRGLQLPALASFEPSTEAAAAAPAGAEVGSSSRSQGVCRCPAPQPQQQSGAGGQAAGGAAAVPTAEAAEIAAPALDLKAFPHLAPAKLKRYDAKQMDWFAEESMQRSTGERAVAADATRFRSCCLIGRYLVDPAGCQLPAAFHQHSKLRSCRMQSASHTMVA